MDIRMNSGMPAPSMESLALAHLRDSCDSLPVDPEQEPEVDKNVTGSSSTLPRRLAGLARLARVGRSSSKNPASGSASGSRAGSLHSSSSQHSASTIHSRSRSKTRNGSTAAAAATAATTTTTPAGTASTTASGSWSCDPSAASWLRMASVDVTDGVAALRLSSGCQERLPVPADTGRDDPGTGIEEENQYWYSCDDDVSETGSTNGEKCPGVRMCSDCRIDCRIHPGCSSAPNGHHHHHHLHHEKGTQHLLHVNLIPFCPV